MKVRILNEASEESTQKRTVAKSKVYTEASKDIKEVVANLTSSMKDRVAGYDPTWCSTEPRWKAELMREIDDLASKFADYMTANFPREGKSDSARVRKSEADSLRDKRLKGLLGTDGKR